MDYVTGSPIEEFGIGDSLIPVQGFYPQHPPRLFPCHEFLKFLCRWFFSPDNRYVANHVVPPATDTVSAGAGCLPKNNALSPGRMPCPHRQRASSSYRPIPPTDSGQGQIPAPAVPGKPSLPHRNQGIPVSYYPDIFTCADSAPGTPRTFAGQTRTRIDEADNIAVYPGNESVCGIPDIADDLVHLVLACSPDRTVCEVAVFYRMAVNLDNLAVLLPILRTSPLT